MITNDKISIHQMKHSRPKKWTGGTLILTVLLLSATTAGNAQTPPLLAGAAVTDITPDPGYRQYRGTSTGVHDPLHAKALVFRHGDQRAALVVADLIAITQGLSAGVRSLASEKTGIPYDNIIVAASHTHTGPEYRAEMELYAEKKAAGTLTPEHERGYLPQLISTVAQAIIDADAAARPVRLQTAVGEAAGISFNRRFHMKNGRVRMNPGVGNPDIVRPAGPVDTDVSILMLRPATGGDPFASLTVFANHLDTVGGTDFSADYPHYLAEVLHETFGGDFVSVFGTGTTGDINHIDVTGGPGQKGHEAVTRRIGETLARVVKHEMTRLKDLERPSLGFRSEYVYAPLQEYTQEELAWARSESDEPLHPERESQQRVRGRKILVLEELRRKGRAVPPTVGTEPWTLPLEVQVIRLGEDAAIVGLPGEVFVELSMAIEKASPFARTYVIELTNVNIAYVPTREAFAQGDYEAVASRVAPGGGELLVDAAVRLLQELKQEQARTASGAVRNLRGDPGFSEQRLPADVRVWYTRMWRDLGAPQSTPDLTEYAASGDIWHLGRPFNIGVSSLLAAFRVTGDLRILDEIDRVMQLARAELEDYNADGFLNWRYLNPRNNKQLYPDDVGAANMWDMETHALTAAVAYAFRVNEDLQSPAGVPYRERAAFWQEYLKNHFEAKWRERNEKPTGYPIVERTLLHPFSQFIRFHHYMSRLTGEESYAEYGLEMANRLMGVTREAETPAGPAYVWPHFVLPEKTVSQPITYARYTLGAVQDLSLEGFGPFADPEVMRKYARTVSELIMLDGSRSFAKDASGEKNIAGFISRPTVGEFSRPGERMTPALYEVTLIPGYAAWDPSGKIEKVSAEVYETRRAQNGPGRYVIPASIVFAKLYRGGYEKAMPPQE